MSEIESRLRELDNRISLYQGDLTSLKATVSHIEGKAEAIKDDHQKHLIEAMEDRTRMREHIHDSRDHELDVHKILHGNGKPGLMRDVETNKNNIDKLFFQMKVSHGMLFGNLLALTVLLMKSFGVL